MSDPQHPTNKDWVMKDPAIEPPPSGELLVVTEGGRLAVMPWYDGALCWSKKPVIPKSVKDRMTAEIKGRL